MTERQAVGKRSGVVLDEKDIVVLGILNNNQSDLSIGDVQEKLNMSHVSFKVHVRRLLLQKMITKKRVPKTYKHILKITTKGKQILRVLSN
jgi:DNA-binding MarR family transcriptional regulator